MWEIGEDAKTSDCCNLFSSHFCRVESRMYTKYMSAAVQNSIWNNILGMRFCCVSRERKHSFGVYFGATVRYSLL